MSEDGSELRGGYTQNPGDILRKVEKGSEIPKPAPTGGLMGREAKDTANAIEEARDEVTKTQDETQKTKAQQVVQSAYGGVHSIKKVKNPTLAEVIKDQVSGERNPKVPKTIKNVTIKGKKPGSQVSS